MKRAPEEFVINRLQSLPARGAWIETGPDLQELPEVRSLPARGAWIETVLIDNMLRGKLVAPRTGGVD